jgi:hypothetical protein
MQRVDPPTTCNVKRAKTFADDDDEDDGTPLGRMPPAPPPQPSVNVQMDGLNLQITQPPPQAAPVNLENISLDAIARRLGSGEQFCWGCEHLHKPPRKNKYPDLWQVYLFVSKNLHTMELDKFCVHLHDIFLKNVWLPRERDGHTEKTNPAWPLHLIRAHFTVHNTDQVTTHKRQIQTHSVLEQFLRNHIATKNQDTLVETPNYKAIELLNKVSMQLHRLNTTDVDKLGKF